MNYSKKPDRFAGMNNTPPKEFLAPQWESPEEMTRVMEALYRVHQLGMALTDHNALLQHIIAESRTVAHAEASSLMLYDPTYEELYFHVTIGDTGDQEMLKQEVRLQLGQGIAGVAAAQRKTMNVEDVKTCPYFFAEADSKTHFETRNVLATPMVDRNQLVGVIEVVNKIDAPSFSSLDVRVMEMFATLAASVLTNARLIEHQIAQERLAAIGQAVTGLSHYIKNIVAGLNSSTELIDLGITDNDPKMLKRSWPILKRNVDRISNFVQDLLSFSKPRKPLREKCAIPYLLKEVETTLAERFTQKKIRLLKEIKNDLPDIWVDSNSIHRCLLNLLSNAIDAVPENTGVVRLCAHTPTPHHLAIEIADNGKGVPQSIREKIFDPFFSTKGSRGTGLGLAVTRKIIKEHHGDISVHTAPEGGALFRVTLPLQRKEECGSL